MGRVIQADTRQKDGKHKAKHDYFEAHGYKLIRSKLYVGDYMMVGGTVSVDTKQSIAEIHGNITADHARFRAECVKAMDAGIQLHVVVENEFGVTCGADLIQWVEPAWALSKRKRARQPIDGAVLFRSMATMYRRYGVLFWFCKPEEAGRKVIEILEGRAPDGDG